MISQTKQKGFTIVELLIVIVVIGILAAISIVAYNGVTQKARDDGRLTDARSLLNAAASYNAEYGAWPTIAQVQGTADVTGAATGTKFNTVKLSGNAAGGKVTATAPGSGTMDNLGYVFCNDTTGSTAIAVTDATGVQVTYYNEAGSAAKTLKTGSGSRCA